MESLHSAHTPLQALTAFKGTLAMDKLHEDAEWPDVKPWDADDSVLFDEDKNDMRQVADMAEMDDPSGSELYKQLCVASQRGKAETLCGYSRLHNTMVCAARLFDVISAFQSIKEVYKRDYNVDSKVQAMKPLCAGILKLHDRLARSIAWGKAWMS